MAAVEAAPSETDGVDPIRVTCLPARDPWNGSDPAWGQDCVNTHPALRPHQGVSEGGRSRHGRTLWNGIAAPAAVVQPQRRQRHAESAARTSEWRCRAQAPRCRCARAARHRPPAIRPLRHETAGVVA